MLLLLRNQSNDLYCKSRDWFPHDGNICILHSMAYMALGSGSPSSIDFMNNRLFQFLFFKKFFKEDKNWKLGQSNTIMVEQKMLHKKTVH